MLAGSLGSFGPDYREVGPLQFTGSATDPQEEGDWQRNALLLPLFQTLEKTRRRSFKYPGDTEQSLQIHMALAAFELLPMSW